MLHWNMMGDQAAGSACQSLDMNATVTTEHALQVEAFKFKDDQKRAIISRLLQRHCVSVALGIPWEKVWLLATLIVQACPGSQLWNLTCASDRCQSMPNDGPCAACRSPSNAQRAGSPLSQTGAWTSRERQTSTSTCRTRCEHATQLSLGARSDL